MAQKKCTKCRKPKREEYFSFKNKRTGLRATICKECHRKYLKKHYKSNRTIYIKNGKKQREKLQDRNFEFLIKYLSEHPCVDCNEGDPVCLTFDHVKGKKSHTISRMMVSYKWEKVLTEISKCVVRCSNCHMKRTAKQFNWRKLHV